MSSRKIEPRSAIFRPGDIRRIPFPERAEPRCHVGDTVWLNSGGPPMTVLSIDGDNVHVAFPDGTEHSYLRVCLCAFDTTEFWKENKR